MRRKHAASSTIKGKRPAVCEPSIDEPSTDPSCGDDEPIGGSKEPKRAPSAWSIFMREMRKRAKAKAKSSPYGSALKLTDVAKDASDRWKCMSESEKAKYITQAAKEKEKFMHTHPPPARRKTIKPAFVTRCSPQSFLGLISKLTPGQVDVVKAMGFGGLIEMRCSMLCRNLCLWLIDRFDPDRCCLNLGVPQDLYVTPRDMETIMGIRSYGVDVPTTASDEELGPIRTYYGVRNGGISFERLKNDIIAGRVGEQFRRSFVLYVLGTLLCPTMKLEVSPKLLPAVVDVDSIPTYNWGKFVLDWLVKEIKRYHEGNRKKRKNGGQRSKSGLGGCLLFLMLFYFDRVEAGELAVPVGTPRVKAWPDELIRQREVLERCNTNPAPRDGRSHRHPHYSGLRLLDYVPDIEKLDTVAENRLWSSALTCQPNQELQNHSFGIHREMISDKVRMDAYRQAILNNPSLLNGAVVLDVGCGTGILGLLAAQAGASRVIAVEASDKMAAVATQIAKDNGLLWSGSQSEGENQGIGVIRVVQGMVDELDKSIQIKPHSVDVLLSEWMGYCLLYKSMLSSVLFARDQWLKPGGAILPDTATIFVAGFGRGGTSIPFWENVYGFNMSCVGKELGEDAARFPTIGVVDSCDIVTNAVALQTFDLATMKPDEMDFTASTELEPKLDGPPNDSTYLKSKTTWCYGVVLWFETDFTRRFCKEMPTVLSTSPYTPKTHWSQTIFTFREPIALSLGNLSADRSGTVGTDACPAVRIHISFSISRAAQHRVLDIALETAAIALDGRKLSWPVQIFHLC